MISNTKIEISYFPGCSLATSAKESNESLLNVCRRLCIDLKELTDWNCCGTSSAHSINSELAFDLSARNLSLMNGRQTLIAACPSCLLRLKHVQHTLFQSPWAQERYQSLWGKPFDPDLNILHFFELLSAPNIISWFKSQPPSLAKIRFVPYYGCMLNHPPNMTDNKNYNGIMESLLKSLGAEPVRWANAAYCCGTFLSAARPDAATVMVNRIMQNAVDVRADCIITACAMCQLNLEIRCSLTQKIPTLHFSEILSLGLGETNYEAWFAKHLVDPQPMLRSKGLI